MRATDVVLEAGMVELEVLGHGVTDVLPGLEPARPLTARPHQTSEAKTALYSDSVVS